MQNTSDTHLEITSDAYRILHHGSVILFKNNGDVTFSFNEINIKLIFISDKSNSDNNIKSTYISDNTIAITCTNYNNAMGTGLTKAIHIATTDNKKIFFRFVASNMSSLPCLTYTFYKEI